MDDAKHRYDLTVDPIEHPMRAMGKRPDAGPQLQPFLSAPGMRSQQRPEDAIEATKMTSRRLLAEGRFSFLTDDVQIVTSRSTELDFSHDLCAQLPHRGSSGVRGSIPDRNSFVDQRLHARHVGSICLAIILCQRPKITGGVRKTAIGGTSIEVALQIFRQGYVHLTHVLVIAPSVRPSSDVLTSPPCAAPAAPVRPASHPGPVRRLPPRPRRSLRRGGSRG